MQKVVLHMTLRHLSLISTDSIVTNGKSDVSGGCGRTVAVECVLPTFGGSPGEDSQLMKLRRRSVPRLESSKYSGSWVAGLGTEARGHPTSQARSIGGEPALWTSCLE